MIRLDDVYILGRISWVQVGVRNAMMPDIDQSLKAWTAATAVLRR